MDNNKQEEESQQQRNHDANNNNNNNNIQHINNLKKNGELDDNSYYHNNIEIGKTIISDRHPNTIDSFWFALAPGTIVKPFDFVTIEQSSPAPLSSYRTKTIGMIQDLQAIVPTDNYHYLLHSRNKIVHSSKNDNDDNKKKETTITSDLEDSVVYQNGITVARVAVMANSEI